MPFRRTSRSPVKKEVRKTERSAVGVHRYIDVSKPSSSYKEEPLRYAPRSRFSKEKETPKSLHDLDPISDEDESTYFNTREGSHMDEIKKLPEATRKIIAQLLKKFSIADINPSDPSFNELMHFVTEHTSEIEQLMAQPSGFGGSNFTNRDRNPMAQPRAGALLQQYLLSNLTESSAPQIIPPNMAPAPQVILPNMAYPLMPTVPSYPPPGPAPGISFPPPPVPTAHTGPYPVSFQQPNIPVGFSLPQRMPPPIPTVNPQHPFINTPERTSHLPSNQFKQFSPQNPALATRPKINSEGVFNNFKATVNKLFGANELFSAESSMSSQPLKFPTASDSHKLNPSQSDVSHFRNNAPDYCDKQDNFPPRTSNKQDNFPSSYQNTAQETYFTNEESNLLPQQGLSIPPPDAKVSFCDAPRTPTKRNLFPVVGSNSGEMMENPSRSQTSVSDVKKSLAQRLAAVLVKVGMLDVPAALLQEMLMKIGAFSSCPPQDISEMEILGILRKLGYLSLSK